MANAEGFLKRYRALAGDEDARDEALVDIAGKVERFGSFASARQERYALSLLAKAEEGEGTRDEDEAQDEQLPLPAGSFVRLEQHERIVKERDEARDLRDAEVQARHRVERERDEARATRDQNAEQLRIERNAHAEARRALDAARAKVREAGFESLDAALAAVASRGPAGVDSKRVAEFAAKAARDAVLAALAGAKPASTSTFTLPDEDGISKRVAGLEIDDAPAAPGPVTNAPAREPAVSLLRVPEASPAANVPQVSNPAVRIKSSPLADALAASRAARKAVRS